MPIYCERWFAKIDHAISMRFFGHFWLKMPMDIAQSLLENRRTLLEQQFLRTAPLERPP
jgi:hypothetical protein